MQRERRSNPQPFDWELWAAAAVLVLFGAPMAALQLARALANWAAGAGLTFPPPTQVVTSLPGIVTGNALAGLDNTTHGASAPVLWAWIVVVHLVLLVAFIRVVIWWWPRLGPGRVEGMADRYEAERALGVSRLRRNRHVIRPDLYPRRTLSGLLVAAVTRRQPDPVQITVGDPAPSRTELTEGHSW